MSWHYSRALVAEFSAANSLDGAAFALSRLIHTQDESSSPAKTMGALLRSQYGTTSEPSTAVLGEALLMWFLVVSRTRTSAWQEQAQESPESEADSGKSFPASLAKWDPATSLWRTHQLSLQGDWEQFSETWPRWGIMQDGECWELTTPERLTSGTASGLWPTPTAHNAKECNAPSESERNTPTLAAQVGGKLNPNWVEWLMNWPIGWTDCAASATDKFQVRLDSHGRR